MLEISVGAVHGYQGQDGTRGVDSLEAELPVVLRHFFARPRGRDVHDVVECFRGGHT